MRYIQTFWSGAKNPKANAYGWVSPEYNLMSWALSCYSLRNFSDEVVLYTDKRGYELLITNLGLPYTEVHVVYGDDLCLPQHWAYSKVKTYSLQTKPFLHVDGDVYLCEPLSKDVLASPLIVQNREIGTGYYRQMMDRILAREGIALPAYVRDALEKKSIASYNMGLFGGNDLSFIKSYCDEVFHFMEINRLNKSENPNSNVDCNVFFEQVFLAVLADFHGIRVADVLGRPMCDEGYSFEEFCNLAAYGEQPFFHILGGHKRNRYVCALLEQTLWRKCPEYIWNIYHLYSCCHRRLITVGQYSVPAMSVERSLAYYEDFLSSSYDKWSRLGTMEIFEMEKKAWEGYDAFHMAKRDEKNNFFVSLNPHVLSFNPPVQWNAGATTILRAKLLAKDLVGFRIFIRPCLRESGIKEVPVGDFGGNILAMLEDGRMSVKSIRKVLEDYVDCEALNGGNMENVLNREILYLISNNLIILNF